MRNAVTGILAALGLVACTGPEVSPNPGEQPAAQMLSQFQATFDVAHELVTFVFNTPAGELQTDSVTIPYGTTGKAAYLHTRVVQWHPAAGGFPNWMSAGISAENLYVNPISNFTAVIDSITPATVGMCNITKAGTSPPACMKGGMASTWTCQSGAASTVSPGIAPCRLNYGTVAHTGNAGAVGTTAGDPGVPLPWAFDDFAAANFTITGHIEGDMVPTS